MRLAIRLARDPSDDEPSVSTSTTCDAGVSTRIWR